MRRRDAIAGMLFVATLGHAHAQQPGKLYRIAIVDAFLPVTEITAGGSHPGIGQAWTTFFDELRQLGYVEGQNLVIERYSGEGRPEHFRELAAEVVRHNPDAIYAVTGDLVLAFQQATATIPVVGFTEDPIALGIVSSLSRPGGNVTGVSVYAGSEIWGKRLALLKEAVPSLSRLGFVSTPTFAGKHGWALLTEASKKLGISLVGSLLESPIGEDAYLRAFADFAHEGADAVFVGEQRENFDFLRLIVELAAKNHLPTLYAWPEAVEIGGLMAYAFGLSDLVRHNAHVFDQILRGAKPAEIPFYQPRQFEFVINLKTAKMLGLTIPPSLLARADEVIE
jgi:putative ABC transport system substrate-binding protein